MFKNRHLLAALVPPVALTAFACPTRPAPGRDGGGGGPEGGKSGSLGADASAGAGAAGNLGTAGAAGNGTGGFAEAGGGSGAGGAGAGSPGGTTGGAGHPEAGAGGAVGGSGGAAGGGCSSACGPTATCMGSACLLNDGQQCTLANQCASGVCTSFYPDVDGDGYGTGLAVGFCGTATPVGYSAQTGDCCDNATNLALAKLIHPNAGFQTTSAGGVCGVTWDYNCDGTVETSLSAGECDVNATYPTCARVLLNYPESFCGMVENDYTCIAETVDNPSGPGTMNVCAGFSQGGPQTLGCK